VQRVTGPRLLRDSQRPADSNPRPLGRWSSALTTRPPRHPELNYIKTESYDQCAYLRGVQHLCWYCFTSLWMRFFNVKLLSLNELQISLCISHVWVSNVFIQTVCIDGDIGCDALVCMSALQNNLCGRNDLKHLYSWGILWLDWIEQCFTSPPTRYRLYGRRFYRSKDPTNSIKVLKEKATKETPENANNKRLPPRYPQSLEAFGFRRSQC